MDRSDLRTELYEFEGRRTQLRSLLSRMETYTRVRPRIIGLSATIRNFDLVKRWVNPNRPAKVEVVEVNPSFFVIAEVRWKKRRSCLTVWQKRKESKKIKGALDFLEGYRFVTILLD